VDAEPHASLPLDAFHHPLMCPPFIPPAGAAGSPAKAAAAGSPARAAKSPGASPASTPARAAGGGGGGQHSTPAKEGTPPARAAAAAAAAAVHDVDDADELEPPALERQTFLAHVVGYELEGPAPTPAERAVLAHIAATYDVPEDFELDKARFGPLSGTCHTQRLLANLAAGTLPLKAGATRVELCARCGLEGHWRSDCPAALPPAEGDGGRRSAGRS
jgi:hypothetical protein